MGKAHGLLQLQIEMIDAPRPFTQGAQHAHAAKALQQGQGLGIVTGQALLVRREQMQPIGKAQSHRWQQVGHRALGAAQLADRGCA